MINDERQKMWNKEEELQDLWNFSETILCILSNLFFKK